MPVILLTGCMFAGKTTRMIEYLEKYVKAGKKCVVIKHEIDNRYADNSLVTHNGTIYQKCGIIKTDKLTDISDADVYAIDEGQFFNADDLYNFCYSNYNKPIIVSALNGDFNQKPFASVSAIVPLAEIVNLSAICETCGNTANFSKLIDNKQSTNKNTNNNILVGGADKYVASCFHCLRK